MHPATRHSILPALHIPARATLGAALFCLSCSPWAGVAASPLQPGLWELRALTTVNKKPMEPEGTRECLSQADVDHPTRTLPKPDGSCTLSNITTNGNRVSYDITCTSAAVNHKGHMDVVMTSESYDGMADFQVSAPGKSDTPMTVVVNARRVGDCTK